MAPDVTRCQWVSLEARRADSRRPGGLFYRACGRTGHLCPKHLRVWEANMARTKVKAEPPCRRCNTGSGRVHVREHKADLDNGRTVTTIEKWRLCDRCAAYLNDVQIGPKWTVGT